MKFAMITMTAIGLMILSSTAKADNPLVVAPDNYKLLLDNDKVRVIEFKDAPGDKIPMHTHAGDYLVYFVAPMDRRFGLPDGKTVDVQAPAGEARWLGPVKHTEENIGTEDAHVIIVEFK